MKKAYTKPEITFDDFSLATTIAAGCAVQSGPHENSCGFDFGGKNLFIQSPICKDPTEDNGGSLFCYNVPFDAAKLFNSL